MIKWIFIFTIAASPAMAWKELTCATHPLTTSFVLRKSEKFLDVSVVHHNGTRYAPFWYALVVPNDLEILRKKASLIEKTDELVKMRWPIEKCRFHEGFRFECFGGATAEPSNGVRIEPFAIYSSRVREDSIAGVWNSTFLNVSFTTEGESQMITMQYRDETGDCFDETRAKPAKDPSRAR